MTAIADLLALVAERIHPPVVLVLGSPRQAAGLVEFLPTSAITCWQMDLYQAERLQELLTFQGSQARLATTADLWDLEADFQTVLFPVEQGGERQLKIDMIEQAFHVLRPGGSLIVLSPYEHDSLFPYQVKKVFGRCHVPGAGRGQIIWGQRLKARPRRWHEVVFQATVAGDGPLRFMSRPGVFTYGRFDLGARALVETMTIQPGDQVLDLGCGCGVNGVFAGRRSGSGGRVVFVDSNLRAVALATANARANGLNDFQTIATCHLEGLEPTSFDVILANPPYYARQAITRMFLERGRPLLRAHGRFYLVTRQAELAAPLMARMFASVEVRERRGYVVLCGYR